MKAPYYYLASIVLMVCTSTHSYNLRLEYFGKLSIENKTDQPQIIALSNTNFKGIGVIETVKDATIEHPIFKDDGTGKEYFAMNCCEISSKDPDFRSNCCRSSLDLGRVLIRLQPDGVVVLSLPKNNAMTEASLGTLSIGTPINPKNPLYGLIATLKMAGDYYEWTDIHNTKVSTGISKDSSGKTIYSLTIKNPVIFRDVIKK